MVILNEEQKSELATLVYEILCEIRSLSSKPFKNEVMATINNLSDSIHNMPWILVQKKPIDEEHMLACIGSAGEKYYSQAKAILVVNSKHTFSIGKTSDGMTTEQ